ncbi:Hypothetical_protein [Hexamita inflata]|uniref:Hypothetical_protein n=1 Tax=Hexamita inflata TaxID=28002 RepID=A0AA86UYI5_9EUKA|nr:Hypothetical protein HINF_LOCUS57227 [Hexamita inflata]
MMTLKLTQLIIQLKTTLSGTWSKQIFKMRSTNSHDQIRQALENSAISLHDRRYIFNHLQSRWADDIPRVRQGVSNGYLQEMSQVKNYFWHAQTQYYSNSTKKDTEPQCTQMI